jgi:hypothetical protein
MKKGRFSKEEIVFIKKSFEHLSYEEIGTRLDRDPESIEKFIKEKLGKNVSSTEERAVQAEYDLKTRLYWRDLKDQFSKDELEMILFHWGRMIGQFRDDVLPTEELQVLDTIKLEILMNRALKEQQKGMKDVENIEKLVTDEKRKSLEDQNMDVIFNMERQIAVLRSAQETLNKDYKDLGQKKAVMLRDMKATREQRIKRLEDSKETFVGWVKRLLDDPVYSRELGLRMEKMRIAANEEKARLSEYHQYEDGSIDQPFLTPETAKDD